MSDRPLLLEIITALEEQGLDRDEYQLQRVIDAKALERLVDSMAHRLILISRFDSRLVSSVWW